MWKLLLIAAAFAAASPLRPVRSARPATLASARPTLARAEPRAGAAAQELQLQDPCIDVSDVTMHLEPPPRVPATFIRSSRRLRARGSDDVEEMPVRIADFAALPADLQGVFQVPEIELIGRIKEPAGDADARGDGARVEEARELCKILENELAETAAPDCRVTAELQHPGANVKGSNEHGAQSYHRQAFPTVWAPFRGGWVFRTADHAAPPGTVLHFANITLVLPNATYADIYNSGFMDFLDLGERGHVCFTNSELVLASCESFPADTYKMWCCTSARCDIVFTQQRLDALGIDPLDPLAHIPCYGIDDGPPPAGSSRRRAA